VQSPDPKTKKRLKRWKEVKGATNNPYSQSNHKHYVQVSLDKSPLSASQQHVSVKLQSPPDSLQPSVVPLEHPFDSNRSLVILLITIKDSEMVFFPASTLGGQKHPHESNHSNSDKETTTSLTLQGTGPSSGKLAIVSLSHATDKSVRWIDVRKKKGKKHPIRSTQ